MDKNKSRAVIKFFLFGKKNCNENQSWCKIEVGCYSWGFITL